MYKFSHHCFEFLKRDVRADTRARVTRDGAISTKNSPDWDKQL